VLIVPGAAVRSYVRPASDELRDRGIDAELLAAPAQPGAPADLDEYGRGLRERLEREEQGTPVDLLVGLSVGAQAAAVAAASPGRAPWRMGKLMLVSPTVDPAVRSTPRLLARWLAGGRVERPGLLGEQAPEWWRAGRKPLVRLVRSACAVEIERLLPRVAVPIVVVHGEHDLITSHDYAAALAADHGGRLVLVPGATHSWPYRDEHRFADLVTEVLAGQPR
jgi:pimeloyl-ACP methyl ester carboxylesterase